MKKKRVKRERRIMWSVGGKCKGHRTYDIARVFWGVLRTLVGAKTHWVYSSLLALRMTTWTPFLTPSLHVSFS